jgi:ubiquinone/menaquinone biosynthesis C-methylase UbiE
VFCASYQERRPIRPDLDENDRTRDENFDIDGVLDCLDIRPGMTVGDVGAGWGYMSFKLARRVAPGGTVLAEDINPAFLGILRSRAAERNLTNVETLLGTTTDPRLPAGGLDMVFMHAVVQFIADRPSFIHTVAASLKDGGRLVIIEPESSGPVPDDGIYGPGRLPTRKGYLEMFRRAALVPVSSEVRRTRSTSPIGSSEYTVFVLEHARKQAAKAERPKVAAAFDPATSRT